MVFTGSQKNVNETENTFRQSVAHIQHRHQVVDITVDTLSHAGVLRTG